MIKKLRAKFVVLSAVLLFLLLLFIVIGMNVLNFRSVLSRADYILSLIVENNGGFPDEIPSTISGNPPLSPEIAHESRYFSVSYDERDNITNVDTRKIAIVTEENVLEYAGKAIKLGSERGFVKNFRFVISDGEDGGKVAYFLDCGRKFEAVFTFGCWSLIVSFCGYLIITLLLIFLSRTVFRPVALSYQKQKRFITDAGHEIKTPLAIINANADVLQMDLGDDESIVEIKTQTKRLSELVSDMVYLAKMGEDESRHFMPVDFPISDLVEESATSFDMLAASENKSISHHITPMLSFYGSDKAIRQLISILLDNALKYSPEQSNIAISLEKRHRSILLAVENDTKWDLSSEDLKMMFERFYRTDSSRNSRTGGHGIGLSIAKAIADYHGGKIQATLVSERRLNICVTLNPIKKQR